jgi:hypothetical protein
MAIRNDFAPGEVLAAADLNDTFGSKLTRPAALNAYSPVITQGVTVSRTMTHGASITLGSLVFAYFQASITGAGTATNAITFTLPSGVTGVNSNISGMGSFRLLSAGNTNYVGTVSVTSTAAFMFTNLDGNGLGISAPTLKDTDVLFASFWLERAL